LNIYSIDLVAMSPPQVGEMGRAEKNTRITAQASDARE
jgi:hypothetical protein